MRRGIEREKEEKRGGAQEIRGSGRRKQKREKRKKIYIKRGKEAGEERGRIYEGKEKAWEILAER